MESMAKNEIEKKKEKNSRIKEISYSYKSGSNASCRNCLSNHHIKAGWTNIFAKRLRWVCR